MSKAIWLAMLTAWPLLVHAQSQSNVYRAEVQQGAAPRWEPDGWYTLGGRGAQRAVAIDIRSTDDGQSLTGSMTYAGEGPLRLRLTHLRGGHFRTEVCWGGPDAPWHANGDMVLGSNGDIKPVLAFDVRSDDGGETLAGTVTYRGDAPIAWRGRRAP